MPEPDDRELTTLLDRLSLEEKVGLLTGRDFWTTWPSETIGLRAMLVSDGPSGVRGAVWDERDPSRGHDRAFADWRAVAGTTSRAGSTCWSARPWRTCRCVPG
ncbi:hypothetical protein [Actinophytocola oryzae]|uniref:Uncharacterized protein n=1 Tax=Actinophytocola oryzae TaxID=502181 RepID=A0A4R7W596_9PSEU|nr:hypothetical protein [Actinophytocola oryzae]TDV57258.1 hypothetical protein CLV71_101129 [Actinophytocola oryzae]